MPPEEEERRHIDVELHERMAAMETYMKGMRERQKQLYAFIEKHMDNEEESFKEFKKQLANTLKLGNDRMGALEKKQWIQTGIVIGVVAASQFVDWVTSHSELLS